MKKSLLLSATLLASASLYATHYMHVNLDNGKEYDIKIEKTDRVSHIEKDSLKYIKILRKDSTYSLYPLNRSKVNFDEEIARMDTNVAYWTKANHLTDGCKLNIPGGEITTEEDYNQYFAYQKCLEDAFSSLDIKLSSKELKYQSNANNFANQLLSNMAADSSRNHLFSPTSLQMALALLANGTDSEDAYNAITKALGCSGIALDSLNNWYQRRINAMKAVDPIKVQIGLANAAWLKKDFLFGKNFLQDLQTYYSASTNNVDFNNDSTFQQIDDWANEVTNGMIPKLDIERDDNMCLVLANGLSFQSEWENQFIASKTAAGDFTTATGNVKQVNKMAKEIERLYAKTDKYQLTTLPFYEGYEMNIVLPEVGVKPTDILSTIDWSKITYSSPVYNDSVYHEIDTVYVADLKLPKFSIDNKYKLNSYLKEMGLNDCFSNKYEKISEDVSVSSINQNTHLEIDEDGAKGAAVTTVTMITECLHWYKHFDMDVNRPFIVCIQNPYNHEVLFVGIINDPTIND